jgi:hypothetical protein
VEGGGVDGESSLISFSVEKDENWLHTEERIGSYPDAGYLPAFLPKNNLFYSVL